MNINLEHDTISEHPFIMLDVPVLRNFQNIDIDVNIGIFSSDGVRKKKKKRKRIKRSERREN